jgi:hypothetical protein
MVTNVDKQIQNEFQVFQQTHLEGHQLFAEEKNNDEIDPRQGHVWIMDPIDGTANLVKQQEDYCHHYFFLLQITDDLQDVFVEIPGIHFEFVYPHLSPNQSDLT